MNADRRRIAFASSDPAAPGDLFFQEMAGDRRDVRLTELNTSLFRDVKLAAPQEFSYKGADGWDIQGWIMRPTTSGEVRPPAILEIHGGPMAMYGWSFFLQFQLLLAHAYAGVLPNPPGRTGFRPA